MAIQASLESFRKVFVANEAENERLRAENKYADNCISTSKYTLCKYASPPFSVLAIRRLHAHSPLILT